MRLSIIYNKYLILIHVIVPTKHWEARFRCSDFPIKLSNLPKVIPLQWRRKFLHTVLQVIPLFFKVVPFACEQILLPFERLRAVRRYLLLHILMSKFLLQECIFRSLGRHLSLLLVNILFSDCWETMSRSAVAFCFRAPSEASSGTHLESPPASSELLAMQILQPLLEELEGLALFYWPTFLFGFL